MQYNLKKRFASNLIYAFSAQGIGFIFSFLMSIIVPKVLSVEQYAYWQLFIFYSTYSGLFHFGLSDGIYLRHGGTDVEFMDKESIGSQYRLMLLGQILLCLAAVPFLKLIAYPERQFVWCMSTIYMLLINTTSFWGFVFQAANRTYVHSTSTIITKGTYICFVIALFLLNPSGFRPFIILYLVAQFLAMIYALYNARSFLFIKNLPLGKTISTAASNIKIGISLTISAIVSSLILGVGRFMVDNAAGIESFGLLSFSVSITNFFISFVTQISMVMFPALRKLNAECAKNLFLKLRCGLSYVVCIIFLLYGPLCIILGRWLPNYAISLHYMIFLLPICVFDGKMQMLYNTYLKVLRKERSMLFINLSALVISVLLCGIAAFVIKDISAVALAMMVSVLLRSIIADRYLSKQMKVKSDTNILYELLLTLVYIVSNLALRPLPAMAVCTLSYFIYLLTKKNDVFSLLKAVKAGLQNKED